MKHFTFALALLLCAHVACAGDLMARFDFREDADERETHHIPITDAARAINLDGQLDEAAWADALLLDDFTNETGDIGPTQLRLINDGEYLYLGFICHENDMSALRVTAEPPQRDERIWGNHCIDFKIDTPDGPAQFIVNSAGAITDMHDGDMAWNADFDAAVTRGDTYWTAELRLRNSSILLPQNIVGHYARMTFGRTDPVENKHTLTVPFGDLHGAARFAFGNEAERRTARERQLVTRGVQLRFLMDREQYPRFCKRGLGRLRVWSGGGATLTGPLSMVIAVMQGDTEIARHTINDVTARLADFEMDLTQLPVGEYTVEARLLEGDDVFKRETRRLVIADEPVATAGAIDLTVPAGPVDLDAYGYTFGVPFPWGALRDAGNVKLTDVAGDEIPMQAEVTSRWSRDGHIRWLLIDAVLPMRTEAQSLKLVYGPDVTRRTFDRAVAVDDGDTIAVDAGALQFTIPRTHSPGIATLGAPSELIKPHPEAGPYMIDQDGTLYLGSRDAAPEVVIESAGPIKAQISVRGWHVSESGKKLGQFILRYAAYRGLPYLHVDHTFIITENADAAQYKDIGYTLPTYAARGYFGAPRITPYNLSGKDASAYLLQLDDTQSKVYVNGKFADAFGRAEGWMNAGSLTITVRDFWQNFPKELEARPDRAIVHFWPGHGETPRHTADQLSVRNSYRHWFAHEGKQLDFRLPDFYGPYIADAEYRDNAYKVSPMGVSKTHQMLVHCNSYNWEETRARSVAQAFQSNPTVTADPQWVCDSKAFGDIGPRKEGQLAAMEKAIDGTMATIERGNHEDGDVGMWTFGDSHHFWDLRDRSVVTRRTWRQTHHNWPRWPWLHYVRTGDKDKFDYAMRNGRNVVDIAHCHYATDELRQAPWPRGKQVGGVCDYKGFLKWSAGNRFGYNSVADVLYHMYYLTGDRRALDTARNHVGHILAMERTPHSREGSARLCSLVEHYFNTWDNDTLELIERHIDNYVRMQTPDGAFPGDDPTRTLWTFGFNRYVDLTRAQRGQQLITRAADLMCVTDLDKRYYPHQQFIDIKAGGILATLAQAYVYTGDPKYARMAALRAFRFYDRVYEGDDPRFRGVTAFWDDNMAWSWFLSDLPYFAYAAQQHGGEVELAELPAEPCIASLARQKIGGRDWRTFHARLRQPRDEPFVIDMNVGGDSYIGEIAPVDAPGDVMRCSAFERDGRHAIRLEVPADGALAYAFRLRSPGDYQFVHLPICDAPAMQEVYPLQVDRDQVVILGGEWFYFDVPTEVDTLVIRPTTRYIGELLVRDAAGRTVGDELWLGANGTPTLTMPVVGDRGNWSLRFRGNRTQGQVQLGLKTAQPLYVAIDPAMLFTPVNPDWSWNDE